MSVPLWQVKVLEAAKWLLLKVLPFFSTFSFFVVCGKIPVTFWALLRHEAADQVLELAFRLCDDDGRAERIKHRFIQSDFVFQITHEQYSQLTSKLRYLEGDAGYVCAFICIKSCLSRNSWYCLHSTVQLITKNTTGHLHSPPTAAKTRHPIMTTEYTVGIFSLCCWIFWLGSFDEIAKRLQSPSTI